VLGLLLAATTSKKGEGGDERAVFAPEDVVVNEEDVDVEGDA